MEAGGGEGVPDPPSDAGDSPKNIKQEKIDRRPPAGLSERRPDKTEAEKPLCCAEEMSETPACQDCSPRRDPVPDVVGRMSQGRKQEPDALEAHGVQGTNSSFLYRPLWGEEMSDVSESRDFHAGRSKVVKAAQQSRQQASDYGTDLSTNNYDPPDTSSSACDPLHPEMAGRRKSHDSPEPSCNGNGNPSTFAPEDIISSLEKVRSRWEGGKPQSFNSSSVPAGSAEEDHPALLAMFRAVASSRLAVRSQQKDEPDFTAAQKLAILRELYSTKPLVFLERFRGALKEEHLSCFQHLTGNYEADFYCAEVRRAGLGKTRHTRVRNKRYAALQQLIRGGEYFSDEQMRSREPLLYEQYIGQYLSNEELQALDTCKQEAAHCLSGVLLDSYQEEVIQRRLQVQQEQEEACEEEEEEEEDSDDDHDEDKSSNSDMDEWAPDPEEKAFLREEFTTRMYQRFLEGKDREFDYSEVDENPDFDNLDIVSRDEEERYFDEEDPGEAEAMEAE